MHKHTDFLGCGRQNTFIIATTKQISSMAHPSNRSNKWFEELNFIYYINKTFVYCKVNLKQLGGQRIFPSNDNYFNEHFNSRLIAILSCYFMHKIKYLMELCCLMCPFFDSRCEGKKSPFWRITYILDD